jgi:hypothetical protein
MGYLEFKYSGKGPRKRVIGEKQGSSSFTKSMVTLRTDYRLHSWFRRWEWTSGGGWSSSRWDFYSVEISSHSWYLECVDRAVSRKAHLNMTHNCVRVKYRAWILAPILSGSIRHTLPSHIRSKYCFPIFEAVLFATLARGLLDSY